MFVRLDHASLQASDLSRADLASEAGLKAAPRGCGVVAVACSNHCTRSAVFGGSRTTWSPLRVPVTDAIPDGAERIAAARVRQ